MYLHIGQTAAVRDRSVIGIFDLEITSQSKITRKFLSDSERAGKIKNVSEDIPRTFIVCGKEETAVYLSQLSAATLQKRAEADRE